MTIYLPHLLDIESLGVGEIQNILGLTRRFVEISKRPIKKVPTLRGRTVINLFMEPSTRTRVSFEIAEKRLSADSINVSASGSSTAKGESLLDTVRNLEAMNPQIIVIRHAQAGAAAFVAARINTAVINAGDGAHAHPTQALLDCATLQEHFGEDLSGLVVAIVGDITHSRVARSNIVALRKLGVSVRACGPKTMIPTGIEALGADCFNDLDQALRGVDVVMVLRIQAERLGPSSLYPSHREYAQTFGLTRKRLAHTKDRAVVMHPGPINRGIEVADDIADGPRSLILNQVSHGVALRMAVLYLLAGSPPVE